MKGLLSLTLIAVVAYASGRRQGRTDGQLDALGRLSAVFLAGRGDDVLNRFPR